MLVQSYFCLLLASTVESDALRKDIGFFGGLLSPTNSSNDDMDAIGSRREPGIIDVLSSFDLITPLVIITSTLILCMFVSCMRSSDENRSAEESEIRACPRAPHMRWLRLLACSSFGLLLLQLVLGYSAHSLTLLADSAHSAADVVVYAFAFYAEGLKRDSEGDTVQTKVLWIDVMSAFLTLSAAVVPCVFAMYTAAGVLGWSDNSKRTGQSGNVFAETASIAMGGAMLAFAVISMFTNVSLMLYHLWTNASEKSEATPEPEFCPRISGPGARKRKTEGEGESKCGKEKCEDEDKCESKSSCDSEDKDEGKDENKGLQALHMVFHPGCTCKSFSGAGSSGASYNFKDAGSGTMYENLNTYTAFLHLAADITRSVVMLIAGALVFAEIVKDPVRTDAICSIIVGACVLMGAIPVATSLYRNTVRLL
eukprot:TRINITY_DN10203_c1_g2_i2.p1 TRINITY_DN10203_c1_g2~~TRINITY_DN10203_c1_g2_i2.p1  ORF type:complete len:425 (+),score=54.80 TRINITY_DN10203_c1_g2_i2:68-1342(+)